MCYKISLTKMGRMIHTWVRIQCPMFQILTWIGSLYCFSYISIFLEWKRLEKSSYKTILVVGSSLENQGLKSSESILRHHVEFFGLETFPQNLICHDIIHANHANQSAYEKVRSPADPNFMSRTKLAHIIIIINLETQ